MTRDDTPAGTAGPHGRPDPDSSPATEMDGADAPSLAAARDAWRALREPLAPDPDLDARIRAAARRAATGPQTPGGSPTPGGAAAVRPPASARGRMRLYAGWGLALAATLVAGIVLVLPPAPLADLPLEAPPQAAPPNHQDAGAVVEDAAAIAAPPTEVGPVVPAPPPEVPPHRAPMPPGPLAESRPAATADGAAAARVEPMRLPPATSIADAPAAGAQVTPPAAAATAVAAPPAKAGADVEATVTAPSPASAAPAARAASPVVSRAAEATTLAGVDDPAAIARELTELRALLRARDPALPARLRAFVARHPAYPLARTDPALAEVLARDPARP